MRVTVIAFFFPPVNQVGYKRPLRFIDWIQKQGHSVTVYAVSPTTPQLWNWTGVDADLVKIIPPGVKVVRTPSIHLIKGLLGMRDRLKGRGPGVHGTKVEVKIAANANLPATKDKSTVMTSSSEATGTSSRGLVLTFIETVQSWFEVPDPYWGWIFTTLPGLLLRSILHRPKFIYVTGPPWSPLITAVLAGKILRIPVHVDFRDPWTLNQYWKAKRISKVLEAWVIGNCSSVIANTDSMGKSFLEGYPELKSKLSVTYNGYEAETAKTMGALRARLIRNNSHLPKREFFTVTHIGMLYPNRMPRSLAACLAEVALGWKGTRPLRLRFVGNVMDPVPLLEEFGNRGVSEVLEFTGEVKTAKAREEEVMADVLLLLQSGTLEQIPAKVFEYAFACVPVLCVADRDSETAHLVYRYGLGQVLHGGEAASEWTEKLAALDKPGGEVWLIPEKFLSDFDGSRLAGEMFQRIIEK